MDCEEKKEKNEFSRDCRMSCLKYVNVYLERGEQIEDDEMYLLLFRFAYP